MTEGELIAFVLTGANVSDRDSKAFDVLAKRLYGKLFADKGYTSQKLFDALFEDGIQLVTGLRVNMKNKLMPFYDKMMLRKRHNIETINEEHGPNSTLATQVCHSIQLSYERIFYCPYSITDTRRKVKQKNGGLHFEGKLVQ